MKRISLSELAEICGADLDGDGERMVSGPASLIEAEPHHISFLAHSNYASQLADTQAGAVLVGRDFEVQRDDLVILRCEDPGRSFTKIVLAFSPQDPERQAGVHPSAHLAAGVELGEGVHIGPNCSLDEGCVVGDGVVIEAGCHLGRDVRIGAGTHLYSGVVCYSQVEIGASCIVHSGTVLGADGFGFDYTPQGWEKTPQCGVVVIEDDVEIGANCTVDRARFGATRIGRNTKIDNMVHIAHNVLIGQSCAIVAQVGIAGSTKVGNGVLMAGQAGVTGHVEIGDGARVGAGSRVLKSVPAGEEYIGYPAGPKPGMLRSFRRHVQLPELFERVRKLEKGAEGPR